MVPGVVHTLLRAPDGTPRYVPTEPRFRMPALRGSSLKASPVLATTSQDEIDEWTRKELGIRAAYEKQVCDKCAKTGRSCATFCKPKGGAKSLDDMSEDELVEHLGGVLTSALTAMRRTADAVSLVEKHRSARKAVGRGISARDQATYDKAMQTFRALKSHLTSFKNLCQAILDADDAMRVESARFDLDAVKAQMAQVDQAVRDAEGLKARVADMIQRRALMFDFRNN